MRKCQVTCQRRELSEGELQQSEKAGRLGAGPHCVITAGLLTTSGPCPGGRGATCLVAWLRMMLATHYKRSVTVWVLFCFQEHHGVFEKEVLVGLAQGKIKEDHSLERELLWKTSSLSSEYFRKQKVCKRRHSVFLLPYLLAFSQHENVLCLL